MTSSILILGGFGTIGARLAERIAEDQRHQLVLSSRTHREPPPWAPDSQTCVIDMTRDDDWSHHLIGIDTVVHLVSLTDFQAKDDPELARRVGVDGTERLIRHACDRGVRRIVFMSTGHVYGTPYTGHITELTALRPQQPYASTHLEAEELLAEAHETKQISTVRLRLSNGFGYPKLRDNVIWQVLINDLCRQAVVDQSMTLHSPGLQERNFIPFTDVCEALIHATTLDEALVGDGVFNLGSTTTLRIVDAAERIRDRARKFLGTDIPLNVPPPQNDERFPKLDYDSSKLRATGLQLSDDLDTEIDALLRYCADNFGGHR